PAEAWRIRELAPDPSLLARNETIFALGNGTLGMRGTFEEGYPGEVSGTYVNGFYEETPIIYGEIAYAYAKNRQVMLNVADGRPIRLTIGGDRLDLSTGTILSYERTLELAQGVLERAFRWRSPAGIEIEVRVRRLVSLARRHVAAIDWSVRVLKGTGALVVDSLLDGGVGNKASGDDPRVGAHFHERPLAVLDGEASGMRGLLTQETRNTRFVISCAMDHTLGTEGRMQDPVTTASRAAPRAAISIAAHAAEGATLRLTKYLGYCTSLELPRESCAARAREAAASAREAGFGALMAEQKEILDDFWHVADVQLDGDEALQQSLRYNLFSLFQSAGRDGRTSIAAKGLTGEGYEGHYFWDTEIYVLPFFIYTRPEIARALLRYRCGILDKARARAVEMSQRGALFPWRTIGGEETSPYYPAGTAQYHINADIAHAFRKYMSATEDKALLRERGAEMLFETARLWADLGAYIPRKGGAFCINEVTGPNEYTALVNNNLYTNLMARENLAYAASTAEEMQATEPEEFGHIARAIRLEQAEIDEWRRAARCMYVPYDRERGIHAQDDAFLDRAAWDFTGTPAESYPLLLHYHPLVIYRHQVLKQPDVVLAQVLLGNLFTRSDKKRNFDYYDPLTTGDSSLSPCIQSVAAAELGYTEMAYRYFSRTARMDLDDVNGNVADGVHTAAMAGTWISIVYGFAGMRDHDGALSFSPKLPDAWKRLLFRLRFRGRLLEIEITRETATYRLSEGGPIAVSHRGRELRLVPAGPVSVSLIPRLECVIFDLDGVLTDTAELHYQAWQRLAAEKGLPFDRTVNEHLRGVSRRNSLEIILRHAGVELAEEEKEGLANRKNGYYRELISRLSPADLLPGIADLLTQLKESGIKTGLASASHNAREIVQRLEIGRFLDLVVDPSAIVKGKPDPEIFFRAAEGLGIPYENCAGVEDAQVGIQAIRAAGMFAVGIGSGLLEADWVLPDTRGLTLPELGERFRRRSRT
ncbi:MAG: beta-phosphoglucomutase, partial [Spirochaetia bacterium]